MAYGYYRVSGSDTTLAAYGLMSFAAVAQFAPALIGGLYWRGASRQGVEAGLLLGFAAWLYTLLLPALTDAGWLDRGWLDHGPDRKRTRLNSSPQVASRMAYSACKQKQRSTCAQ